MIYLLLILTFSLVFLIPVKFHITVLKKISGEYIKLETNLLNLSKIILEIPDVKFSMTSLIPILSFEYKVSSKNKKNSNSKKFVISPLRDRFKRLVNFIKFFYANLNTFRKLIHALLSKVSITYLNVDIIFGSDNPALTGILVGHIWSAIYQSLGLLSMYLNFNRADIRTNVRPIFLKYEPLQMEINCIFHLRVGYIIIASFIITWYWLWFKHRQYMKKGRLCNG